MDTDLIVVAFLDGEGSEQQGRTIDMSTTASFSEWIEKELNDLRGMRDELRVQVHLGKAELRERWDSLDRALETLEQRAKHTARAAEQPLQQLEDDLRKLAHDLRDGYRRIREAI